MIREGSVSLRMKACCNGTRWTAFDLIDSKQ